MKFLSGTGVENKTLHFTVAAETFWKLVSEVRSEPCVTSVRASLPTPLHMLKSPTHLNLF